ncbi:MAG: hypothetical protein JWQ02_645 [Capsulimonas sp.]|nr:hypothetical protein [Capsulimonas sp.]
MASQAQTIDALLNSFSPSSTALLDWLKPRVDDAMLWEIAQADYGFDAHKKLAALLQIRNTPETMEPLEFGTQEVLELIRWSEPDDPLWQPSGVGERGHWMRLFSCAVLLKVGGDPVVRNYLTQENSTLIQLVASVLRLGQKAIRNVLSFVCWRTLLMTSDDEAADGEYPFFAMSILLLCAAEFEPGNSGAELALLADWVIDEELRTQNARYRVQSDEWLLGLTNFDSNHDTWRKVTSTVLLDPTKNIPEPAASALRQIAERIPPRG